MEELESRIKDAEENLGEQEVRDALLAKAEYLASLGDKDAAKTAFDATEAKTTGFGNKMDLVFSQIRCVCLGAMRRATQSQGVLLPNQTQAIARPCVLEIRPAT